LPNRHPLEPVGHLSLLNAGVQPQTRMRLRQAHLWVYDHQRNPLPTALQVAHSPLQWLLHGLRPRVPSSWQTKVHLYFDAHSDDPLCLLFTHLL